MYRFVVVKELEREIDETIQKNRIESRTLELQNIKMIRKRKRNLIEE